MGASLRRIGLLAVLGLPSCSLPAPAPDAGSGARSVEGEGVVPDAAAPATDRLTVDPAYEGKYEGDERLPRSLEELRRSLPRAAARLARRLGVEKPDLPPVVVVLRDAGRIPVGEGLGVMETTLRRNGSPPVAEVLVTAEALLSGSYDIETCMAHELVHALHLEAGAAGDAPPWMMEGLAHWLSRAGEGDLEEMVLFYAISIRWWSEGKPSEWKKRPTLSGALGTRTGIEDMEDEGQRIAGTLLFHHLERVLGEEAFRTLALRLLRERGALPLLKEATGKTLDELLPEVRDGYLVWAEEVFRDRSAIEGAMAAVREGDLDRALELTDAYLRGARESPLVPAVLYFRLINLSYAVGRPKEALLAAGEFLRRHPRHPWVANARLLEARAFREAGDRASARDRARVLLRDFAWIDPEIGEEAGEILAWAEEDGAAGTAGDAPEGDPPAGGGR
ncbi:MAG: hypothetical protein HUU06_10965 [Planctomycetaceae bacterium]|nr:hypothetical protein [Planctomycetaceae bacterium]